MNYAFEMVSKGLWISERVVKLILQLRATAKTVVCFFYTQGQNRTTYENTHQSVCYKPNRFNEHTREGSGGNLYAATIQNSQMMRLQSTLCPSHVGVHDTDVTK